MVSNKPTFFIITPSYNQGHFIKQTLESLLNQKGVLIKSLVMDGGSSDKTVSYLKKFGKKIEWISKKDRGQSDALNQGFKRVLKSVATKDRSKTYVSYLNSDDYLLPNSLKVVADTFAANPQATWLMGDCLIVNQDGERIQEPIRLYKKLWRQFLSWNTLLILNPIPQPAVFWKLSHLSKIGLFNDRLHYTMDYEYWLRSWQEAGPPLLLSQPLSAFRIHGGAKSTSGFASQFAEQYQVASQLTQNKLLLSLQKLHNQLIIFCYNFVK